MVEESPHCCRILDASTAKNSFVLGTLVLEWAEPLLDTIHAKKHGRR